jgi:hypothetical protein
MQISNHILKLQGKAELPREIEIGQNYHISLEGGVPSFSETDNEDGTHSRVYTFRPIKIDLLDPKGNSLKLKDTRSKSQLFRARVWSAWKDRPDNLTFEEYYDGLMDNLIKFAPEVVNMYQPKLPYGAH